MNTKKNIDINTCIFLYVIAAMMYNTSVMRMVGYFLIILATLVVFATWLVKKDYKIEKRILLLSFLIIGLYVLLLCRNITGRGFVSIFSLLVSFVVLLVFSTTNFKKVNIKLIKYYVGIQLIIIYLPMLLGIGYSSIDNAYKSIYTTTTFLGLFSCISIELCIILYEVNRKDKIWWLYILLFVWLVWVSKVRTALVGIIIILAYMVFRNVFEKKGKLFWYILKWIFYIGIFFSIIIYPNLDQFSWFSKLQYFVYNITGKLLLTGRNTIWKDAFEVIVESPIIGYGLTYDNIYSGSIHNSYLNILLQGGMIALFLIWKLIDYLLNLIINNEKMKTVFIFSLVNLLMCVTEVMLLQGQIVLQIMMWGIFAIGINGYNKKYIGSVDEGNKY